MMWKVYSKSYIKNNPESSHSIQAAAFFAALFLSLLCTVFYNLWIYDIENISAKEGSWQARIQFEQLSSENVDQILQFENVKKVVVNDSSFNKEEKSADIYFNDPRYIYEDMPVIARELGLDLNKIEYHDLLLSRYFIHDPKDESPPMLLGLFLGILILMVLSLVLIIRGAFDLSMNSRIHQFGILSSIGATPQQIRKALMQEALALSSLPIFTGTIIGIFLAYGFNGTANFLAKDIANRHTASFHYGIWIFIFTIFLSFLTVWICAWIPAKKISKLSCLQAIRYDNSLSLKKKRSSFLLSKLFSIEGELAGNALKAQNKSLRISSLSLLLSYLGFSIMLCFVTLSTISTQFTYFARYQDAWDIMSELKRTELKDFDLKAQLESLNQVKDVTVYQKSDAALCLSKENLSQNIQDAGGLEKIAKLNNSHGVYEIPAPIVIMDDESFLNFADQAGIQPSLKGSIVLNRIWDSTSSNFRYPKYIPFVKEDLKQIELKQKDNSALIPVLGLTDKVPVLKEEYPNYSLVQFMPLSLWNEKLANSFDAQPNTFIRFLAQKPVNLNKLNHLEKEADDILKAKYDVVSENRLQEKADNDKIVNGMVMIYSLFCILLAIIGIANLLSTTLGFFRQRKREFAQYMSIGMSPKEMKKMFFIEGMVIAGKPLLITLPLTFLFIQFSAQASYIDVRLFWKQAPIVYILLFAGMIVFFTALAYSIGAKRLLDSDLTKALRNDTLF